jgi:hypothetical protein
VDNAQAAVVNAKEEYDTALENFRKSAEKRGGPLAQEKDAARTRHEAAKK